MKRKQVLFSLGISMVLFVFIIGMAVADTPKGTSLGNGFTYQGQLKSSDTPYTGSCDFAFGLFDVEFGGTALNTLQKNGVSVNEGYFTVILDYGSNAFSGENRWLEISVRCPTGTGDYTLLEPRQVMTAAPYALFAKTSPWSGIIGLPAGFSDGVDNDTTYSAGTGLTLTGTTFSANTTYLQRRINGTCDSGYAIRVVNADGSVTCEAVSGSGTSGWSLTGNAGTNPGTNYLGTSDDKAFEIKVNNSRVFRFEPNSESPNLIGGYSGNWLLSDLHGVTIAGGGMLDYENRVTDIFGTVSGGGKNQAGNNAGDYLDSMGATVSGGAQNTANGQFSVIGGGVSNSANNAAVVGGGISNNASGLASFIGGGELNTTSNQYSTIGGGKSNTTQGDYAAISGGWTNTASGLRSFIGAGYNNNASGGNTVIGGGINNIANTFGATVGGGNYNVAGGDYAFIGGGESNETSSAWATIAGGFDNLSSGLQSTIGGGKSNISSNTFTTVSGGSTNQASGYGSVISGGTFNIASASYATISGGGPYDPENPTTTSNRVTDNYGTVGGGSNNQAGDGAGTILDVRYATVAGGYSNIASGESSFIGGGDLNQATNLWSSVSGGRYNRALADQASICGGDTNIASGIYSFVGGGGPNTSSGSWSSILGGSNNIASGEFSSIPGGQANQATGNYSFAAGRQAQANLQGCFVWGDSTNAAITCNTANQWLARASGGVTFWTDSGLTTGVTVGPGGGSWSSASDKNLKENFTVVNSKTLLENLAKIPITTWNYKTQDETIRHIGPVAQDFYAAFGVGEDNTHITTIDADGVALAAIQGLYEENQELKAQVGDLEARLSALEKGLQSGNMQPAQQTQSSTPWMILFGFCLVGGAVVISKRSGGVK